VNNIEHMAPPDWQRLFAPASVAVIGASNTRGSWGYNATKGLLDLGGRRIYPVNPNSPEVLGQKAYTSVKDIPDSIDLAVVVVNDRLVPMVLRECVAKSIKAAIVISSGFAETGEQGRALQTEMNEIALQGGLRFIGPNSMGHAGTREHLSTFGQTGEMPAGPVAFLSQSGSTCLKVTRNLTEARIALSKYVSTGNETNLIMEDYLEYLGKDENTTIIAAYIEGLRDGRRFFRLAKDITARKPIVVTKVGGTAESAKAVLSHTAALAGADAVYSAAFKQSGVIRVEDDDELCDVVSMLHDCPVPRGNRVGILSIGGGPGAMTAEACEKEGLAISTLTPSTIARLDKNLPSRWSRRNPVDMSGPSAAEFALVAELLWPLIEDENTDIVFLLAPIVMSRGYISGRMGLTPQQIKEAEEKDVRNLRLIREKIDQYGKPVILMWQSGSSNDPQFRKERLPVYSNARRAARALHHLVWYRKYLEDNK
jgi:acyl-CoA synthetase (NDP forming)